MTRSLADALVRVLLAPACASCDGLLDHPLRNPVCESCWRGVPLVTPPCCARCGDALASWRTPGLLCTRCRRQRLVLSGARSAGRYSGSLRRIIQAFKYEGRRVLARRLSAMMREAGGEVLDGADALVPVPLHPWRALQRGFNQADDLAAHIGLPVWRVLRRSRHGPPQASLPASQRHSNVRGAYRLRALSLPALADGLRFERSDRRRIDAGATIRAFQEWHQRLGSSILENRTIVLVDDVMTTGATLNACAEVLIQAGAHAVRALTAARAEAGRPLRPPP